MAGLGVERGTSGCGRARPGMAGQAKARNVARNGSAGHGRAGLGEELGSGRGDHNAQ